MGAIIFGYFVWALLSAGAWLLFILYLGYCEYLPVGLQGSPWQERLCGLCIPFSICMCIFWNPLVDGIRRDLKEQAAKPAPPTVMVWTGSSTTHVELPELAKLLKEAEDGQGTEPGTHVLQQPDMPQER